MFLYIQHLNLILMTRSNYEITDVGQIALLLFIYLFLNIMLFHYIKITCNYVCETSLQSVCTSSKEVSKSRPIYSLW